jgi:hypothetical protein
MGRQSRSGPKRVSRVDQADSWPTLAADLNILVMTLGGSGVGFGKAPVPQPVIRQVPRE